MAAPSIESLEKLLGTARDGALLHYSLGVEYSRTGNMARAAEYFRGAVEKDPGYSAAWRALGKALEGSGRSAEALAAYRDGIAAAQQKGDKQAEKEMTVFARRIERKLTG